MNQRIILILLLIRFSGIDAQNKNNVIGKYKLKSPYDTITYLQINSDLTFLYHRLIVDKPIDYRGQWHKHNSYLVLNSFIIF